MNETRPREKLPVVVLCAGGTPLTGALVHYLQVRGFAEIVLAGVPEGHPGWNSGGVHAVPEDGTAALGAAARVVARRTPLIVWRGDTFFTGDPDWLVAFHVLRKAPVTLALVRASRPGRFLIVETGEKGVVTALRDATPAAEAAWVYAGVAVCAPSFLDTLPAGETVSVERVLSRRVGSGLYGCRFPAARCFDLHRPEEAARAAALLDTYPR
ncbi:MAG: hypothetical protein KatS3mg043_1197 [Rhodothermaceae bacterium]|nr:MAG: hypothetical protein KatS3mg043_1197 [Rhodothermaceae bacterium]